MSYLLDTCTLLWFAREPERLSGPAFTVIAETDEAKFFSVASIWEIGIKVSLGKLKLDSSVLDFARSQIENTFKLLPIQVEHAALQAELPWHHRDLFDRMLIAQAMSEDLQIITSDPVFGKYRVTRVW